MKRIFSVALILVMIFSILPQTIFAYEFPKAFWAINSAYTAAVEAGDNSGIIEYGNKAVELMLGQPENDNTVNVLASRLNAIGKAYAETGDYAKSADAFEKYIPYGKKLGWDDGVKIAEAKVLQYRPQLKIFTDGNPTKYYGAKNEPKNGILFGVNADGGTRNKLENESMIILYHELGSSVTELEKKIFSQSADAGIAIEFALNCPNEASDIINGNYKEHNLSEISALFAEYPLVPVYLRFGAEFDVWSNSLTDPAAYVEAFRYVSSYFKSRNTNVAMVFSPNHVSGMYTNVDDYYPGDDYVDWVGMSSYYQKYFQGNPNITDDYTEVLFKTGINSDPVLAVQDIIKRYGDRKPIMISESGFTSYVRTAGEDTTDWAIKKLKEFYNYVPMVYPQVKLIAHFDRVMANEANNFALSNTPRLQEEYIKMTKTGRFIQNSAAGTTNFAYEEVGEGYYCGDYLNLYSYAHIYGEDVVNVAYYIGNQLKGLSSTMPFCATLDLSDLPNGQHTLTVLATGSKNNQVEKQFVINKSDGKAEKITVTLNGKEIAFDQPPILYRNRTMVPMRAIFEALGATVSWDDAAQTASGVKGSNKISAVIGNSNIFKNDEIISFDVPSFVVNGRTLVPVRAIAESFDCTVEWDGTTNTVKITE